MRDVKIILVSVLMKILVLRQVRHLALGALTSTQGTVVASSPPTPPQPETTSPYAVGKARFTVG